MNSKSIKDYSLSFNPESIFEHDNVGVDYLDVDISGSVFTLNPQNDIDSHISHVDSHFVDVDEQSNLDDSICSIKEHNKNNHRIPVIIAGWMMPLNLIINAILISDQIDVRVLSSVKIYQGKYTIK
ncbi:hypothetical protein BB561_001787 [Smittium simulii]|uniref:Uncharacterized protein n=1 Tax=Smittium simulii TaxID=133385 RepID=A0A2T9YT24_9FUNG|nr:hypothetical protein BB561_001787 [Smittium simulii]